MVPTLQSDNVERKKRFAAEFLKSTTKSMEDAFRITCTLFGADTRAAMEAAREWPHDPEVIGYTNELVSELGDLHFLPTKADLAMLVWNISNDGRLPVEDRLKAARLYGDIRGFIERQQAGTVVNNNVLMQNKVMLVKDHGTDESWEQQVAAQQRRLIDDASAPRH